MIVHFASLETHLLGTFQLLFFTLYAKLLIAVIQEYALVNAKPFGDITHPRMAARTGMENGIYTFKCFRQNCSLMCIRQSA